MRYPNISNDQALLLSFYLKMLPLKANSSLKLFASGKNNRKKKGKTTEIQFERSSWYSVHENANSELFSKHSQPSSWPSTETNAQHAHRCFYSSQNQKPPCALCTSAMK